jgi:hypothetical protein
MNRDNTPKRPAPLVSLFRGLYTRVAQKLGVDTSYVSRVARGERKSDAVTAALSEEMQEIFTRAGNHNGNHHFSETSRVLAKEKEANNEGVNLTLASVKKELSRRLPNRPGRKNEETTDSYHYTTTD